MYVCLGLVACACLCVCANTSWGRVVRHAGRSRSSGALACVTRHGAAGGGCVRVYCTRVCSGSGAAEYECEYVRHTSYIIHAVRTYAAYIQQKIDGEDKYSPSLSGKLKGKNKERGYFPRPTSNKELSHPRDIIDYVIEP